MNWKYIKAYLHVCWLAKRFLPYYKDEADRARFYHHYFLMRKYSMEVEVGLRMKQGDTFEEACIDWDI